MNFALNVLLPCLTLGRQCLPDAIPESERRNITLDGFSMPVGIWQLSWDTSRISSKIFGILASEMLGHQIQYGTGTSSYSAIWALAGCPDVNPDDTEAISSCIPPRRWHFSFENWQAGRPHVAPTLLALGQYAPINLGSGGYTGFEGLFVMKRVSEASLVATGLPLTYFSHYNASWFQPQRFAVRVGEVDLSRLSLCNETVNGRPSGQQYHTATGDDDGMVFKDGLPTLKCWQEKWWAAPACRSNVSDCLAVVTGGDGWGMEEMPQQAFFLNMPLAFATASDVSVYNELNREIQSLLYWWFPDVTFFDLQPERVEFPRTNSQEFRQGIYRTMRPDQILTNLAAGGLDQMGEAEALLALAKNLQLSNSDIDGLLKDTIESDKLQQNHRTGLMDDDQRAWETACRWLKTNELLWQTWVPRDTDCLSGQGLVDALGNYVENISEALKCSICPVGRAALLLRGHRICSPCPPGSFQNFPGESACLPCEPGSITTKEGSFECEPCSLGYFANQSGMTKCIACGPDGSERWTTSQMVASLNKTTWIQIQGATSETFCACVAGSFFFNGSCRTCMEGSHCPGSNRLELLPGYFSTAEEPGEIYQCFGNAKRCPGGSPGQCAFGRDTASVVCSRCQQGSHSEADGTCTPCTGRHVAMFTGGAMMSTLFLAVLYILLLKMKLRHPTSLVIVTISLAQMITVAQMLTVLFQFKIAWEEPFLNVLQALELLAFNLEILGIQCISPWDPTAEFAVRVMLMPIFCIVVFLVHVTYACLQGKRPFFSHIQLAQLISTVGTVLSICFIPVFSSLLAPFQCLEHPNGRFTLQDYHGVFCNLTEEHLQMCIIGSIACLLPIGYLALCTWVVMVEVPKMQDQSGADLNFMRSWSFLLIRFRPGTQVFSVLFLARNALVVLCQLLSDDSVKVVLLNLMLYVSLILSAYYKPWRFMICNWLDIWLVTGFMTIVDMGAVTMRESPKAAMIICMCFLSLMIAAILAAASYGLWKYVMQTYYRKRFGFFLSHQKSAAGCCARLLKMELVRVTGSTVFLDSDDLVDVSRMCRYVSQDTQKFVIFATADILKRRWVLAELVTAQLCEVPSILITWPSFQMPDADFIANFAQEIDILNELSKFSIFQADIEATFWWLQVLDSVKMPAELTSEGLRSLVGMLTKSPQTLRAGSQRNPVETKIPVLADPENPEAVAAALILLKCLQPHFYDLTPQLVESHMKVPKEASTAIVIMTAGCFWSQILASWLMQVHALPCGIMPIIAEDTTVTPVYEELLRSWTHPQIKATSYVQVIKAVFRELAVRFVPASFSSSQADLELHAKKVYLRLQINGMHLAQLVSLADDAGDALDADRPLFEI